MKGDFLSELGLNAVVTRMKRVSDAMLHDGKRMYKELGMDIEPNWFAVFKLLRKHDRMTRDGDRRCDRHVTSFSHFDREQDDEAGYLEESRSKVDSRKRILSLTRKQNRKMPEFEQVWDAGTAGFKKMMQDTDLLGTLDILEQRIAEKGFRERTLEQLRKIKSVEIVEYDDRYSKDFARLNYEWIRSTTLSKNTITINSTTRVSTL